MRIIHIVLVVEMDIKMLILNIVVYVIRLYANNVMKN